MHRSVLFAPVLLSIVQVNAFAAADSTMDRATLRGIKAVKVVVEPPGPELERAGLTITELQARVEQKLHDSDIPLDSNAVDFVGVRVTTAQARRTPWAVSITLGIYQVVSLTRDPKVRTSAATWETDGILLVPPKQLQEALFSTIDQLTNHFVEAYRSVNSK